ncbi:hypothetical protein EV127DRAFT_486564 [Xylaria flabelliformis]|nr:hypothetical protein EV127DRAFT_486564 [Xylaria flabelliformis]KAI0859960.1 hypothetical protein F4860DRAFT_515452 [Xylaria cubensis]
MRFIALSALLATGALAAVAELNSTSNEELAARDSGFKVNYYTDGGCTAYLLSLFPFTDGSCYGYQYTGENSANIANCDAPSGATCLCTFFVQDNCEGAAQSVSYNGENCASNFGRGFQSMSCAIIGI